MSKTRTSGFRTFHFCSSCQNDILPGQEYRRSGSKKHHIRPDCKHAKSETAKEPPPVPDETEVRFHCSSRTRLLRCYSGTAQVEHDCHACLMSRYCNQQMLATIFEGSSYDAEVWLIRGELEVRFFHRSCPYNPEDDDSRDRYEEDDLEETGYGSEAWPMAA